MASSINASTSGAGGVITTADNSGVLNLQSGGTTVATVNSSGFSTPTGSNINVPNTFGFKNRLINGSLAVWQRGTSFTVGAATWTYTADRYAAFSNNTSTTVSQNPSVPSSGGFLKSIRLQRPSGNTGTNSLTLAQVIESENCYDLSGQSVTLSFWAKTGANYSGGALTVQVTTGTAANQGVNSIFGSWTGQAYPINYNPTLTTTWTKYTYTGTFGSGVLEAALILAWTGSGTAGADDSVFVTGIQVELGSQATSFDFRSITQELALCQRYYQAFYARSMYVSNSYIGQIFQTSVPMRVSPTIIYTDTGGNVNKVTIQGTDNYTVAAGNVSAGVFANYQSYLLVDIIISGAPSVYSWWAVFVYANAEL